MVLRDGTLEKSAPKSCCSGVWYSLNDAKLVFAASGEGVLRRSIGKTGAFSSLRLVRFPDHAVWSILINRKFGCLKGAGFHPERILSRCDKVILCSCPSVMSNAARVKYARESAG